MERRSFIKQTGLAGILAAGSAPVFAQSAAQPEVKWRLASSFPKSLDTLYGCAVTVANRVAAATNNKFQIQVFAAGEIVPAFGVVDAVQQATIQCACTAPYYFYGKDPTFAFPCAVPFGMNARMQNAWMYHGGGLQLTREFLQGYNIINFPMGNTGTQMGGWFRKEIKSVDDLKGLKFRIGGYGGAIIAKVGGVPQQIAGGDIYPALEKGTIDAAEWVGPYDDEKLGFYKVAKNYYYPGWWEGGTEIDLFVNTKAWADLPKDYQAILESACYEANVDTMAKYDAANPAALRRLIANGVQLRAFPREVMQACWKATNEVNEEVAAKNPAFKKILEPYNKFRNEEFLWFSVAERSFDDFMVGATRTAPAAAKKS
jgi:TRAP-type mannitol/chloroaromatic compound transport system substrate-binding protein